MTRTPTLSRAAVLGAGVMGAQIAAHLANAGCRVLLLDRAPDQLTPEEQKRGLSLDDPRVRLKYVQQGFDFLKKLKPAPFFTDQTARRIEIGTFPHDLEKLEAAEWIIEAVVEDLEIKQELYATIAPYLDLRATLSTNTSGLSIGDLSDSLPAGLRNRFLGTHFFNPPRYLKLVELISGPDCDPKVVDTLSHFIERRLGKGIVTAKDTPNFIANRIGVQSVMTTMHAMGRYGLSITDVDALTGPLIGRPKSATFRTADVVGIDVLLKVAQTVLDRIPDDPARAELSPPPFVDKLVASGRVGQKAGAGFYRKEKKRILEVDPATLEYRPQPQPEFEALGLLRTTPHLCDRVAELADSTDPAAEFVTEILVSTILYAGHCLPEIADSPDDVDAAMRWGFGWELGPFELADALGIKRLESVATKLERDLPKVFTAVGATESRTFYQDLGAHQVVYIPRADKRAPVERPADAGLLEQRRRAGKIVEESDDGRLVDLGEEVVALEFKTKRNTLTQGLIDFMQSSVDRVEREFAGLVIGGEGEHFSAGANLKQVAEAIGAGQFEAIDQLVADFQALGQRFRTSRVPVVTAPRGQTLGGGCELVLASDTVCAAAETYIGLVEVGAGLIPAGGGIKETLRRLDESVPATVKFDLSPLVQHAFQIIGMARVAAGAEEARQLGFLRSSDVTVMNSDFQMARARDLVVALNLSGYRPAEIREDIRVVGSKGYAALQAGIYNFAEGGMITEYDAVVGDRLAYVLAGGDLSAPSRVSEQYLLDLERQVFLELCRDSRTLDRMVHLLKTGKPLRN